MNLREKARAISEGWLCATKIDPERMASDIAAFGKACAEEAERMTADHFAKQEARFRDIEARLAAFTSVTPDSPEVKEAVAWCEGGWSNKWNAKNADVLARALRAAQAKLADQSNVIIELGAKLNATKLREEGLEAKLAAMEKKHEDEKQSLHVQVKWEARGRNGNRWAAEHLSDLLAEVTKERDELKEDARLRTVPYHELSFPTRQRMREEIATLTAALKRTRQYGHEIYLAMSKISRLTAPIISDSSWRKTMAEIESISCQALMTYEAALPPLPADAKGEK